MSYNLKEKRISMLSSLICLQYSLNPVKETKIDHLSNLNSFLGIKAVNTRETNGEKEYHFLQKRNYSHLESIPQITDSKNSLPFKTKNLIKNDQLASNDKEAKIEKVIISFDINSTDYKEKGGLIKKFISYYKKNVIDEQKCNIFLEKLSVRTKESTTDLQTWLETEVEKNKIDQIFLKVSKDLMKYIRTNDHELLQLVRDKIKDYFALIPIYLNSFQGNDYIKHFIEKVTGDLITSHSCKEKIIQKIKEIYAKIGKNIDDEDINYLFQIEDAITSLNIGSIGNILDIPQIKINHQIPLKSFQYKIKQFSFEDFEA